MGRLLHHSLDVTLAFAITLGQFDDAIQARSLGSRDRLCAPAMLMDSSL